MSEFNERDVVFLKQAGEAVVDPIYPGLLEGILRLKQEGVGRSIVMDRANEVGKTVRRDVGYILPLKPDQSRHLVIFVNGGICITEPSDPKEKAVYKAKMQPNNRSLSVNLDVSMEDLIRLWMDGSTFLKSKVIVANENEESVPVINKAIQDAILLAFELRDQRREAHQSSISQTAAELVRVLDITFDTHLSDSEIEGLEVYPEQDEETA